MPRIVTFLSKDTIKTLNELSKSSGKPVSKIASEFAELGCQTATNNRNISSEKNVKIIDDSIQKQMEYLLRILNITSEILRKIYSQPSKTGEDNAESILNEIKKQVDKYLIILASKPSDQ